MSKNTIKRLKQGAIFQLSNNDSLNGHYMLVYTRLGRANAYQWNRLEDGIRWEQPVLNLKDAAQTWIGMHGKYVKEVHITRK